MENIKKYNSCRKQTEVLDNMMCLSLITLMLNTNYYFWEYKEEIETRRVAGRK